MISLTMLKLTPNAENQFFISNTQDSGVVKNTVAAALVERIVRAAQAGEKFHVCS